MIMKNILSKASRSILEEFAWSNVLLAFDFDGTLAPIVADPEQARMRHETRELLELLSRRYRVVVISGRAQPDALRKLRGSGVLEVIGNHGIEPWSATNRHAVAVQRWIPRLNAALSSFKGIIVEDKVFSVAVHYRQSREKKVARSAILEAAGALDGVRLIRGKQVVNVLPSGVHHKGTALERARERLGCDTAIYVGDDETDEDVFGLEQPGRLLSIRVGAKRASAARFYLPDQRAVDELLRTLVDFRRRSEPRGRAAQ